MCHFAAPAPRIYTNLPIAHKGLPLAVDGPPERCAAGSGRAARKECYWKAGGPRPPGPPRPPGGGRGRACAPRLSPVRSNAAALCHSPVQTPQAYSLCEALPQAHSRRSRKSRRSRPRHLPATAGFAPPQSLGSRLSAKGLAPSRPLGHPQAYSLCEALTQAHSRRSRRSRRSRPRQLPAAAVSRLPSHRPAPMHG